MKKIKDTFDHRPTRPTRQIKHFEAIKVDKTYRFLKSNIPFLTQNSINGKSLNWTPTGYATHLPSGDKTFSRFKHLKKPYKFFKVQYTFTKTTINGKSLNWTPTGYATHFPSGDKTFGGKNPAKITLLG